MNLSNDLKTLRSGLTPTNPHVAACRVLEASNFNRELEKLALILARTWKEDHPEADPNSEDDFNDCVIYVATGMARAGAAVGGPVGSAILNGGGSAAARAVCKCVF